MADAWHHALSSARKWGGRPEDYLPIHKWFDETKAHFADPRHRAMRHHSEGIAHMIECFGPTITVQLGARCSICRRSEVAGVLLHKMDCNGTAKNMESTFKLVPTRWVGEQHVLEDFGFIPTVQDFLKHMTVEPWMVKGARKLSKELENEVVQCSSCASIEMNGGTAPVSCNNCKEVNA